MGYQIPPMPPFNKGGRESVSSSRAFSGSPFNKGGRESVSSSRAFSGSPFNKGGRESVSSNTAHSVPPFNKGGRERVSSNKACFVPPFNKGGLGGISSTLPFISLLLILTLLTLSLNGCGWRLRGSLDSDLVLPSMHVQYQSVSAELKRELTQALKSTGVELLAKADESELLLVLHSEKRGRRVLSVGSSGKVSDYELQYTLEFSVRDNAGTALISNEQITQQRDYSFDESAVLAKSEEERKLFDFMRRMSIQTLMRRLHSLSKNKPATTAPSSNAD